MDEQSLEMLHEVSLLMMEMRRVCMSAAIIRSKYRHLLNEVTVNKYGTSEKNQLTEKNLTILKKILGEMDIIEDVNILSRHHVKKFCEKLDPAVEM